MKCRRPGRSGSSTPEVDTFVADGQREQALTGRTGQLGARDAHLLGQLEIGNVGVAMRWVSFGTAVHF